MIYRRQKSLLALVESLGGRVKNTDFQKLLLLWTQCDTTVPYEFVPYRFGAFSFSSYADRRKLIAKGMLSDDEDLWELTTEAGAVLDGAKWARASAADFVATAPMVRGAELVALTYRELPFYATRSEIAEDLLSREPESLKRIDEMRPSEGKPGIATLGYEKRSLEAYLVALMTDGVTLLCDVRRNPLSRRYGFSRSSLSNACSKVGIRYEHLRDLGISSADRRSLETQEDYDQLFADYERDYLPNQQESLNQIADWVRDGERVALTCYEKHPHQCHRHCVADALERAFGEDFSPAHL